MILVLLLPALVACLDQTFSYDLHDPVSLGCDNVTQHSGYISFGNKNLFFWFFESRHAPSTDPVIMWLTGGPGCSSMLALLSENGPCTVDEQDGSLKHNPYSWNEAGSVLWVDQPVGTGFSYGSPEGTTEKEVAEDMYQFLEGFFAKFPQYQKQKFYVTGESYAGHYVPAVSARIVEGGGNVNINFGGCAIGNGLTDPSIQYGYYADMAYKNDVQPIVAKAVYDRMVSATPGCLKLVNDCQTGSKLACETAQAECNSALVSPVQQTGINLYDIRVQCKVPPLCYDFSKVTSFLNEAATKTALGAKSSITWASCNYDVNGGFRADWMKDYQMDLVPVLAKGLKVVIYAGADDYICNWMGNKAWAVALDWPGQQQFNSTADSAWNVAGKQAGEVRTYGGFYFVKVFAAGHMVPMDQPQNALAMIKSFLL